MGTDQSDASENGVATDDIAFVAAKFPGSRVGSVGLCEQLQAHERKNDEKQGGARGVPVPLRITLEPSLLSQSTLCDFQRVGDGGPLRKRMKTPTVFHGLCYI